MSADFTFGSISRDISIAVGAVTTVTDTPALRAAVLRANADAPNPVIINIGTPYLVLGGSSLPVTGDIAVRGTGAARTELNAELRSNHFEVTGFGYLELNHLKMTGGKALTGGSISVVSSSLLVADTRFEGNSVLAEGDGGAVYLKASNAEISDSEFHLNAAFNNGSGGGGGAIYTEGGHALVSRSTFTRNRSMKGGAIYSIFGSAGHLRVVDSAFDNNYSLGGGAIGAVHSSISVQGSRFVRNEAAFDGGAIAIVGADRAWITNSFFDGNIGAGFGSAAIYWQGNNWGGFHGMYSALYVLESEFQNHRSSFPASVILAHTGEMLLRGSKLHGNGNLRNCASLSHSAVSLRSLGGNRSDDGSCPQ